MIQHWHEKYLEEYPDMDQYLEEFTYKFQKKIVKAWLLEGHRVDGRQKNEIRPLSAEVGVLPRVHGPACSPAARRRCCPWRRWTPSPPARSWIPSGRRRRSGICTTTTSPATRGRGQARPQPRPS